MGMFIYQLIFQLLLKQILHLMVLKKQLINKQPFELFNLDHQDE